MAECEHCGAVVPLEGDSCPSCGQARSPDELLGREILGRYRLVKLLAEGGMGRVYLAEQAVGSVQRQVAVKVLRKQLGRDKQLMTRFAREAETLVRLTHPNTVQLFDFGALSDGTLAFAMEYVKGHSLAFELHKGPVSVPRTERLLAQICGALEEAHESGIVHRDLKPDNLLIADRSGQGDFVKVLDFGIAKVAEDGERKNTKLTQQGMIIGTPPYMSPEQFSGEAIDARSDIYSLGVIAFEMLTGHLPFVANTPWEWASKHLTASPEALRPDPQRGLSAAHARAIEAALQKRPEERPQSVHAFLDMFTTRAGASAVTLPLAKTALALPSEIPAAASDPEQTPTPSVNTARIGSSVPKRSIGLAGGVLGALALAALGTVLYFALRSTTSPAGVAPPAALPAFAPAPRAVAASSAPASLPFGAAMPESTATEPAPKEPAEPRPRRHHSGDASKGRASSAEAEQGRASPSTSGTRVEDEASHDQGPGGDPPAPPAEPVTNPPVVRSGTGSPSPPRVNALTTPTDLQARISQISANLPAKPEVALGLYQAATGRYGPHASLTALRPQLTSAVESRIRQLLPAGRCAQAQAMQRALRGAFGGSPASGLFGSGCPAP